MAFPTALTNQNPIPTANLDAGVVGNSPAIAMGNYYLSTSTALSQAALNATNQQQQSWVAQTASMTQLISDMRIISLVALSGIVNQDIFA